MPIEFAYVQARVQARLGTRLAPAGWRLLESSRDVAQYLHAARATVLAPRVQPLAATSSTHAIERSLRGDWRGEVGMAARWVPARWRAAVAWTAWLVDLPVLAWLERGGEVWSWMRDDPSLSDFAFDDATLRHRELAAAGLGALIVHDDVTAGWRQHFESLWPSAGPAVVTLHDFIDLVDAYRERPADATGHDAATETAARERLEARTVRLIRKSLQEPVTVFCHLLLVALDLGRLRDGLVRRALFDDQAAVA